MEALLAALPAGGGAAAATAAVAVVGLSAVAGVRMGSKQRANTPPGDDHLAEYRQKACRPCAVALLLLLVFCVGLGHLLFYTCSEIAVSRSAIMRELWKCNQPGHDK